MIRIGGFSLEKKRKRKVKKSIRAFASERGKARIAGRKSGLEATSIRRKVKMKQDELRKVAEESQMTLEGVELIADRQKKVVMSIDEFERKVAKMKKKKMVGDVR